MRKSFENLKNEEEQGIIDQLDSQKRWGEAAKKALGDAWDILQN